MVKTGQFTTKCKGGTVIALKRRIYHISRAPPRTFSIFKITAVSHLGFLKVRNFKCRSCDDRSRRCGDMSIFRFFKMVAVRHLGFVLRVFGPPTIKHKWWSMWFSIFCVLGLKMPIHALFGMFLRVKLREMETFCTPTIPQTLRYITLWCVCGCSKIAIHWMQRTAKQNSVIRNTCWEIFIQWF